MIDENHSESHIIATYMRSYPSIREREMQHKRIIEIWDKRHVTWDWKLKQLEKLQLAAGPKIDIDWEQIRRNARKGK